MITVIRTPKGKITYKTAKTENGKVGLKVYEAGQKPVDKICKESQREVHESIRERAKGIPTWLFIAKHSTPLF